MTLKNGVTLLFLVLFTVLFFGPSLAAYPNLRDYPTFLSPNVYIIVGGEGSATDVAASTDISISIKGELPGINIETKLDRDIVNPYGINKNFLLIGSSCTNKLIALIMGKTYPSCGPETGIPEDSAIIKIYDGFTSGYYALVVSGWNDTYTRMAASVLKKHNQFLSDKYVKAVKVTSESSSGITPYYETLKLTTTSKVTTSIFTTATYFVTSTFTTSTILTTSTIISTTKPVNQEIIDDPKPFLGIPIIFWIVISIVIFLVLAIFLMFLFKRKETLS